MEVYMIRHTSVGVPQGTCYGWTDVPLAETFEQEAAVTREKLSGIKFDKVFTSPLSRARRLADFCGYPDAQPDDRLKEMNMGDWEMKFFADPHGELERMWHSDFAKVQMPGGESFPQLYERVADFFDDLRRQPYDRVAVFAHGGVLICGGILCRLFAPNDFFTHLVPPGGVQVCRI